MKLTNFDLESSFSSIALIGFGFWWDLHNGADFGGLSFDAASSSLSMLWDASSPEGPTWGDPTNQSQGCKLIFRGVTFLQLSPRDGEYPQSEDLCVSGISKVIPNTTEFRCQDQWAEGEEFNLLFEFHSERSVEVGAESVEMEIVF